MDRLAQRNLEFAREHGIDASCLCRRCIREKDLKFPGEPFLISSMMFIVCPECGNKRCPHASDHSFACTVSNEPGQEGSVY